MTKKDTNHLMMYNLTNLSEANIHDSLQSNTPNICLSTLEDIDGAANNKIMLDAQTLHQLQVRLSQSSQKRFIFFDRCGGKNRIYLHPSLLKDLSHDTDTSDPSALRSENECYGFHPQTQILSLNQLCNGNSGETPAMPSSFAVHNARESSMFIEGMQSSLHPPSPEINANVCADGIGREANKCIGADLSNCSLFNDTDDLEALLSSDDEASTGQFPCSNEAWASTEIDRHVRKHEKVSEEESHVHKYEKASEEENEQKGENDLQDINIASMGVSFTVKESKDHCPWTEPIASSDFISLPPSTTNKFEQFSRKTNHPSTSHGSKLSPDASSSSSEFSSSNNLMKRKHSATSLPLLSGSAKNPRSSEIKQTVQMLRSIIPGGGDYVDTAFFLDKAIQYIASLQQKVQALEEGRHSEINKEIG